MRPTKLTLLTLLLLSVRLVAQDTISGVINHYASVLQIAPCAGTLIVDDAGSIQPRDTLLLIQMQGAEMNLSNTANFGQLTDLAGAGLFEPVAVDTVMGDTIQVAYRFSNAYDPAGKVQVVRIPYYDHAVVGGTLRAQPWDGNTGGILALYARTLTLQADIDVSGQGFRGGSAELVYDGNCSWLFSYDNYRYGAGSIRSGGKGEGVAGIPIDWPRGRGPAANGGGAGNDHNSGGGGGAQLSAGGRGGENDNPSIFGCQGPNPGLAGRPLPSLDERLFLGGGGGAGHGNNEVATDGGNGGGLVVLITDEIQGNGFAIRANGADAATAGGDGAGGGGAGGTIFVKSNEYENELAVEALGGQGGDADNNNADQCFGPGGGGSGGRILGDFTAGATASVAAGNPGITFDSAECPDGPNGATAGLAGTVGLPLLYTYSLNPILEPPTAAFDFTVDGLSVQFDNLGNAQAYEWSFGDGSGSSEEAPVHTYGQIGSYTVTLLAINPSCGDTVFTSQVITLDLPPQAAASFSPAEGCAPLQVEFTNNSSNAGAASWVFQGGEPETSMENNPTVTYNTPGLYSVELRASNGPSTDTLVFADTIRVLPPPVADFQIEVDGLGISTTNLSEGEAFTWLFGDGGSSTEVAPTHTYATPGEYDVRLIASNACGSDTSFAAITVGSPPIPNISIMGSSSGCAPKTLLLSNATVGFYDSLRWELPGGIPAFSTEETPAVVYNQAGSYTIRLLVFSPFGTLEATAENVVTVYAPPVSDFSYAIDGLTVSFTNLSTQASSYVWNFDDGNTSQAEHPVHTYAQPGFYEVTLNASNPNCARSVTQGIFLNPTSATAASLVEGLILFPNPTTGQVCLLDEQGRYTSGVWRLYNLQGKVLRAGQLAKSPCWNWEEIPVGAYYLLLKSSRGAVSLPLLKVGN